MKVAIIHPWFPQYRVDFFEKLVHEASAEGTEISVFYGATPPEWKDRNDAGSSDRFTRLPTRFLKARGRTLILKSLQPLKAKGPFDLVIVEQAVRNIETYQLLLAGAPLAFWGHGKTYTTQVSEGQEKFKQWLTRRGSWFFAYTPGGVEAVVRAGTPREVTTVVQNSIDTSRLREQIASVERKSLDAFTEANDLRGKTALFVGGLDESKRLPFLFEAAGIAHRLDPDFRLLVAGSGSDRGLVEQEARRFSHIRYLGPLFSDEKALAIASAQVLAMPGRVGLIAVDSFAGGTPIVTTDWKWHAPEFEYLESGANAIITADEPEAYAQGLAGILQDASHLAALSAACVKASEQYTVEAMVQNFLHGVRDALHGLAA